MASAALGVPPIIGQLAIMRSPIYCEVAALANADDGVNASEGSCCGLIFRLTCRPHVPQRWPHVFDIHRSGDDLDCGDARLVGPCPNKIPIDAAGAAASKDGAECERPSRSGHEAVHGVLGRGDPYEQGRMENRLQT